MTNEQNSVSTAGALTNSPQQVGDEAESYFSGCCFHRWIVAIRKQCQSIKQYIQIRLTERSFNKTLREYNVSDVLEKAHGEDNRLGQGAHSKVNRYQIEVEDRQMQDVAYKVLDTAHIASELQNADIREVDKKLMIDAKKSFAREKKALAALSHPNIIKPVTPHGKTGIAQKAAVFNVRTFSEDEKSELQAVPVNDDSPDIDFDFDFDFEIIESVTTESGGIPLPLADTSLAQQISDGSLTAVQKDSAARELTGAVAHMHNNGYVHLDIKPGNVLRQGDTWLLSDFGCAHHYSDLHRGSMDYMPVVVKTGFPIDADFVFGTPAYMSPQLRARSTVTTMFPDTIPMLSAFFLYLPKNIDPLFVTDARAADAYSLGLTLCEILTGQNPSPNQLQLEGTVIEKTPETYQKYIDKLLDERRDEIGDYYEILEGLLKSDCSQRMTVPEAERLLAQIPQPVIAQPD